MVVVGRPRLVQTVTVRVRDPYPQLVDHAPHSPTTTPADGQLGIVGEVGGRRGTEGRRSRPLKVKTNNPLLTAVLNAAAATEVAKSTVTMKVPSSMLTRMLPLGVFKNKRIAVPNWSANRVAAFDVGMILEADALKVKRREAETVGEVLAVVAVVVVRGGSEGNDVGHPLTEQQQSRRFAGFVEKN